MLLMLEDGNLIWDRKGTEYRNLNLGETVWKLELRQDKENYGPAKTCYKYGYGYMY